MSCRAPSPRLRKVSPCQSGSGFGHLPAHCPQRRAIPASSGAGPWRRKLGRYWYPWPSRRNVPILGRSTFLTPLIDVELQCRDWDRRRRNDALMPAPRTYFSIFRLVRNPGTSKNMFTAKVSSDRSFEEFLSTQRPKNALDRPPSPAGRSQADLDRRVGCRAWKRGKECYGATGEGADMAIPLGAGLDSVQSDNFIAVLICASWDLGQSCAKITSPPKGRFVSQPRRVRIGLGHATSSLPNRARHSPLQGTPPFNLPLPMPRSPPAHVKSRLQRRRVRVCRACTGDAGRQVGLVAVPDARLVCSPRFPEPELSLISDEF